MPDNFDIFSGPLRATLKSRANACKWSPLHCEMIADICDWQLMYLDRRPGYEGQDGLPDGAMRSLIRHVQKANQKRQEGVFASLAEKASRKPGQADSYISWQRDYASIMKRPQPAGVEILPEAKILSVFGAAHAVLCDTIPGYRPKLYSAWDRRPGLTPG